MDKVEVITVTKQERMHTFYCDECGEFIQNQLEYDDGWTPEPSGFEAKLCIENDWKRPRKTWYIYKKRHLCEECKEYVWINLINNLQAIGFEVED